MATYNPSRTCHKTAGAGVVDTITLSGAVHSVVVTNRDASTNLMWVTVGRNTPTDPSASADETLLVKVGERRTVWISNTAVTGLIIKVLSAAATPYDIEGLAFTEGTEGR